MTRAIVVGDVHGCYYTLKALLKKMQYNKDKDHLYFLGDTIGKGKHSEKVLDFVTSLEKVTITLGNHELHWLYQHFTRGVEYSPFHQLGSPNVDKWVSFLLQQSLVVDTPLGLLVHASVAPSWSAQQAVEVSHFFMSQLRSDPKAVLQSLQTAALSWSPSLSKEEQLRSIYFICTKCRYYHDEQFDTSCTDEPETTTLTPWYLMDREIEKTVWFGHWAALKGREFKGVVNLDGGAVYGGQLMAAVLNNNERFEIGRVDNDR